MFREIREHSNNEFNPSEIVNNYLFTDQSIIPQKDEEPRFEIEITEFSIPKPPEQTTQAIDPSDMSPSNTE